MILFALIYLYQKVIVDGDAVVEQSPIPAAPRAEDVAVRIIGGEVTNIVKYPFAVSVQRRLSNHFCGGTYVAPRFVLSAAHCMVRRGSDGKWTAHNPRMYYVIAGSTNVYFPDVGYIQMALVDAILPHSEFRFADMQHDIGLFRLRRALHINEYVQFVRMPKTPDILENHKGPCTVIGWGRSQPDSNKDAGTMLRHVNVSLIPVSSCPLIGVARKSQICAGAMEGGRDACQGDSGGPLLCNSIQVGIVSWGIGCAQPNRPGVYSRVDFYLDWINSTIVRNSTGRFTLSSCIIAILVLYYYLTCNTNLFAP